jgi:hypothetical protein
MMLVGLDNEGTAIAQIKEEGDGWFSLYELACKWNQYVDSLLTISHSIDGCKRHWRRYGSTRVVKWVHGYGIFYSGRSGARGKP